jgi:hypothetical protein
MELYDNWGSAGEVLVDGEHLPTYDGIDFSREPYNDHIADTEFRSQEFTVEQTVSEIVLKVRDITNLSEVFIDDLVVTGQ